MLNCSLNSRNLNLESIGYELERQNIVSKTLLSSRARRLGAHGQCRGRFRCVAGVYGYELGCLVCAWEVLLVYAHSRQCSFRASVRSLVSNLDW